MTRVVTTSAEETRAVGRAFAAHLQTGDIVALVGTLGSGKTQFVLGVCDGLGTRGHIGSPTFTLIHEYPSPIATIVHIDLYRIVNDNEVADLGIDEYFRKPFICLIEWAERMQPFLPDDHIRVDIEHGAVHQERVISIRRPERPAA